MTKHVTPYPFTMIPVDMTFNQSLSDSDIRVFLTIASLSGYDEIRPSINWIAEQTNKSDSTVRRAIAKLTECGYLSTYERYNDKTGARLSNGYRLEHPMYQRVTPLSPVNRPPSHSYDNSPPSPVTPKIDISNTDTENITINAAGVDDDKTTSQMIDEIPSAGWNSLTPAWQKVTPLIAEYYGLSESDGLCKVLACYFTRESRHIKKGSEWAEYHLETALTVDQLKTLLQHWKTSLPAIPTKPMTIQANVSKWKHAQTEDKFDFDNPLWITH